ncbi:regulation of nuclear pre-mRNA domain-containing protein 1B-like [Punica granatum]|uniref:Regulation of nuclear pre-mRNA domain-containing protein 1B-like n=1 Tax=Punica granatum TaxID=22663 RepID=A0A6P8DBK9_PUNGR|nr:regulation of nuclear pre-mRNA domain-containing protein 1B-like [Punica granatum]XP_031391915.1 regulation of nuclear pre-mRNA domain-containing protein 1B-like [Punica granatum]
MSNEDFNAEILAEKLSKLNNSQQSIESLSQWCVSHRKKAKLIVETWDRFFNSSQKEKCVSFLYLANDILQNSRRKGSEFVNEFWKVLPAALKHVYRNGDDHGKKVVTRLVNIWEERKVFGSRGHGLKDDMLGVIEKKDEALGKDPPPPSVSNGKSSNPIKIVKKDSSSLRIKLAVGGLPEKILTAFQSVFEESSAEDDALNKCSNAAQNMGKIGEEAENSLVQGNQQGSALVDDLQDQENGLLQCIHLLESAEATRAALVSQLKEALEDQESKLELIRAQLQVAQGLVDQANNLRKRLTSSSSIPGVPQNPAPAIIPISFSETPRLGEQNLSAIQPNTAPPAPLPPLPQPTMMSFPSLASSDEESKKAAVAAVAAKLAASTSSAQMFTSVLSSLVAEEVAASMNGGLKSGGFSGGLPIFPPEKKPKLEKPIAVSEVSSNSDMSSPMYFNPQSMNNPPLPPSMAAQPNQMQAPFASPPPPPPPMPAAGPPLSSANPPNNHYVQSSGLITMPYAYGSSPLPPPPPLPPQVPLPLARPLLQPPQQTQPEQTQQPGTGGYYRPPGVGFFGQGHQSTTSALPRQ